MIRACIHSPLTRYACRPASLNSVLQWWERHTAGQSKFQLAIGFNLIAIAFFLPYSWNRVVEGKWQEVLGRRAAQKEELARLSPCEADSFAGLNATERVAVENAVNERRTAAGKTPWPYDKLHAEAVAAQWRANWLKAMGPQAAEVSTGRASTGS